MVLGLLLLLAFLAGPRNNALAAPMAAGATNSVTPSPTSRPGADFSGTPLSGSAPLTVQFTALNSNPLSYCSWTFGDGTSQGFAPAAGAYLTICPSVAHTYPSAGSFNVTLYVVKGTNGFSNSMTKTGYIQVSGSGSATPTKTSTAVLVERGHVHVGSASGPALANVKVCTYLAAYQFDCDKNATLTDQNGYYQLSMCVPQQEDVTIVASLSGYTFSPAFYSMINYGGCTNGTFDFVAQPSNVTSPTPTPTLTPTRTLTPTVTPTSSLTCSPVIGTITAPFTFDGAGTYCWRSTNLGSYINSWNLTSLIINGVDFSKKFVPYTSLPPKINGYWYVTYTSSVAWGHFEAK
jgi:PKD repeat protein